MDVLFASVVWWPCGCIDSVSFSIESVKFPLHHEFMSSNCIQMYNVNSKTIHTACSPKTSSRVSEDQVLLADWLPSLFQFQFSTRLSPKLYDSQTLHIEKIDQSPSTIFQLWSFLHLSFVFIIIIHSIHDMSDMFCLVKPQISMFTRTSPMLCQLTWTSPWEWFWATAPPKCQRHQSLTSRFDVEASSGAKNESSLGEKDGEGRGYWGMKQNHGGDGIFFGEFANLLCACVLLSWWFSLDWSRLLITVYQTVLVVFFCYCSVAP